jgi:hypothetical protein
MLLVDSSMEPAALLAYKRGICNMQAGLQVPYVLYKSRFCVCKEYEIQLGQGKANECNDGML